MNSDAEKDLIPAWVEGKLTPVGKLQAHLDGLRHKAVSVFVMDGDAILLQRRALTKYHTPGLWANTCCTHPHWAESGLECANRRLKEELGLVTLDLSPRGVVEYRANVGDHMIEHEVVELFTASVDQSVLSVSPNPDEVMETRWARRGDLFQEIATAPESFTPWLRIYLEQHVNLIFD